MTRVCKVQEKIGRQAVDHITEGSGRAATVRMTLLITCRITKSYKDALARAAANLSRCDGPAAAPATHPGESHEGPW